MNSKLPEIAIQIKEYRVKLGDKIKVAREKKGYSTADLAEIMKIKPSTISNIEKGKFSITVDYLVHFSILLDCEFIVAEKYKN